VYSPAAAFFAAVPFGPTAGEYTAWFYFGGGKEIYDEMYATANVRGTICFLLPPEGGGWFRKEIKTVEDLRGLKLRYPGLAGRVMDKLGASTQLLAAGDIYPALELGTIDGTEFSTPAIDLGLGFYRVAKFNYYPGWHQPSTLLELIVNMDKWKALNDTQRLLVETVCGDQMRLSLAEGEATQFKALNEIKAKGGQVNRFPPEVLARLEQAWQEVAKEESARDPWFRRAWESLTAFRADYATWRELGYLR
jgi:TRAP-type mannitol/chloroaromatic compound transport system substrate-binding protein